jgi:Tol biopolymer transport system component
VNDTRELLRRGVEGFEPMTDAFERVLVRRDRKRRNQRVAAGVVGIAVFALAVIGLVRLLGSESTPARPEPTQPRNGRWVVFTARHLNPNQDAPVASRARKFSLYVAGPDGAARLLVGSEGDKNFACPTFSPDGSLLAYGERRIGRGVAVVVTGFTSSGELEGPEVRITVPASSHLLIPCPEWAPNGQRLATIAPGLGVLVADIDGRTDLVRFGDPQLADGVKGIEWSPDGTRVAVLLWPPGPQLWVVPADGGAARTVTGFGAGYEANTVNWASDGRSVIVAGSSDCCVGLDGERAIVKVVDVVTGDASDVALPRAWDAPGIIQMVPTGTDRFLVLPHGEVGWEPLEWLDLQGNVTPIGDLEYPVTSFVSLSPDGKQMLYVTYDPTRPSQGQALVAVPLDGSEATRYSPWTPQGFGDNYSTFAWQPR